MSRLRFALALALGLVFGAAPATVPISALAATLLPNGEQQFFDNDGNPLANGTVEFYIPATTTPKNTWQDAGQTTLNTNPVQLDSAGRARIYGNGQYRQIVKDALGNTIWDRLTQDVYGLVNIEWCGTSGGTANAQTLTPSIPVTSYVAGLRCAFVAGATNTGAATINISGLGAIALTKISATGPVPLTGGELRVNNISEIAYDGTQFQLISIRPLDTGEELVNLQTGTTYTVVDGDRSKLVTFNNSSGVTVTLPTPTSATTFIPGWFADFSNTAAGGVTLEPQSSTIDGATQVTIPIGRGLRVVSDGVNYYGLRGLDLPGTLTPPVLSSSQSDYAPTGLASATVLRLSATTSVTLTGLAGGHSELLRVLLNVGTNQIALAVESASSTAVNRFTTGANVTLSQGGAALLRYDGTSSRWRAIATTGGGSGSVDVQVFNASGTWTKPASGTVADVQCWGAGGSGGAADATIGAGGGGGGAYVRGTLLLSSLGATETVTIGAGGTAVSGASNGNAGGNSTFGSWLTAFGGGGGGGSSGGGGGNPGGGGGGSPLSAGTSGSSAGGGAAGTLGGAAGAPGGSEWAGGGGGNINNNGGAAGVGGGGGGGGNNNTTAGNGGSSKYGGGGGAGASGSGVDGTAGSSQLGGSGGAVGVAGSVPGGGGGGSNPGASSGAGAAGRCIVTTY